MNTIKTFWSKLPIGTRSVLFGAHCFFLHPIFVALAWRKLYGFPFDPRLWVAFIVHDIGYWGKPNMDGEEGEKHVEFGAKIMGWLFDRQRAYCSEYWDTYDNYRKAMSINTYWHDFSLYHSRHYAKQAGAKPSRLCFADKLAFNYQCKPLYLWMTGLTGELDEYLTNAKYWNQQRGIITAGEWYDALCLWIDKWIADHIDGSEDTVTVDRRVSGRKY